MNNCCFYNILRITVFYVLRVLQCIEALVEHVVCLKRLMLRSFKLLHFLRLMGMSAPSLHIECTNSMISRDPRISRKYFWPNQHWLAMYMYARLYMHSESVYSHSRMLRLLEFFFNVWREKKKLPFPVWREVWNWVQLLVWQPVDCTGMETSTHDLTYSEIVSQHQLYLLCWLRGRAIVEFPGVGRWRYRTLCPEVVPVISLVQLALFIPW